MSKSQGSAIQAAIQAQKLAGLQGAAATAHTTVLPDYGGEGPEAEG